MAEDIDKAFINQPSFSVSYNIMGIAMITYSIIHQGTSPGGISTSISAGGQHFSGYVTSISTSNISGTNWFETNITLVATTD